MLEILQQKCAEFDLRGTIFNSVSEAYNSALKSAAN